MKYLVVVAVISACILSFLAGRHIPDKKGYRNKADTVTVLRKDTIVQENIITKNIYVDRIVKDTLFSTDTVKVEVYVPISNYVYEDSLFRAEISGYKVSLDRMEIRRTTVEKKIHVPYPIKNNRRWGLGVSVGYAVTPHGGQPYVGIGLQYNIIFF